MTEQRIALSGGVRTAIGKFGGSLQEISALDLGAEVVKGCLARAGAEPAQVQRVVLGENIQVTRGEIRPVTSSCGRGSPSRRTTTAST